MYLANKKLREIPFLQGKTLSFRVGEVGFENKGLFRYTCSVEPYDGSHHRITLQFLSDDTHTPYVFDVFANSEKLDKIEIKAGNEDAQKALIKRADNPLIFKALDLIFREDIHDKQPKG